MSEIVNEKQLSTADLAYPERQTREAEDETTATEDVHDEADVLFAPDQADTFQTRWMEVQTKFVDDPRVAVQEADGLVAEVIKRIAETFAEERAKLETQWSQGEDVSTEDLRLILQRYRSFFRRLLAV